MYVESRGGLVDIFRHNNNPCVELLLWLEKSLRYLDVRGISESVSYRHIVL